MTSCNSSNAVRFFLHPEHLSNFVFHGEPLSIRAGEHPLAVILNYTEYEHYVRLLAFEQYARVRKIVKNKMRLSGMTLAQALDAVVQIST